MLLSRHATTGELLPIQLQHIRISVCNEQNYRIKHTQDEYDFSGGKRGALDPIPAGKTRITIRLDDDILEWFRTQAEQSGGGNYQTAINQALHAFIDQQSLEELLRRVVREELRSAA